MENFTINNLTLSELHDLECALHHIIACYVNCSHTCKGLTNGTEYRTLKTVLLSEDDFNVLSKLHENIYNKLLD